MDRGLTRVTAFATEPPRRQDRTLGQTWDFIGIRNLRLERWKTAADAFRRTVETSSSPRILMQWAYAETKAGDLAAAQRVYHVLLERTPDDLRVWRQLAITSEALGDRDEARRAAMEMLKRDPGNAFARGLRDLREDSLPTAEGEP